MPTPNLLLIIVDDLRPDLGCYGDAHAITPHLDALAASGTVFRRAYCQTPVCGPSRASLLSGRRPAGDCMKAWNCLLEQDLPGAATLPSHLTAHGRTCLSIGKVFHHGHDSATAWSQPPWRATAPRDGTWIGRGYLRPENQAIAASREGRGPAWECMDVDDDAYGDGVTARTACAALDELSAAETPFVLATGFTLPHLPFNAPQRYWDLHPEASIGDPRDFFVPEHAPPKALHQWGELRQYHGIPPTGPLSADQARTMIRAYRACTSYVDAQIGRVLTHLHTLGRDHDTTVVVLGDHGWFLGEHTLWCKHSTFHLGIHAPLIVRAPGHAPAQCDALVEFTDIFPTVCDLAGLPAPEGLEGDSLVPLLHDPHRPWKPAAFSRYVDADCVVTDTGAFTRWHDATGSEIASMFYDHRDHRRENRNVADDPAYAAEVARHRALLAAGWRGARPSTASVRS